MLLAERVEKEYVEAYKGKDALRLSVLRHLKTAAKNRQVELMRPLTDEDYMDVVLRQAKQRKDSIEQYQAAGRDDLARQEADEYAILAEYLPKALDEKELAAVVEAAVREENAQGPRDMGRVMSRIMGQYRGRVDGKRLSEAVRLALAGAGKNS